MNTLAKLAKYTGVAYDESLPFSEACRVLDAGVPPVNRSAILIEPHYYQALIEQLVTTVNHYRRVTVIRVDLVLPYGGMYPGSGIIDAFFEALQFQTAEYCLRRQLPNYGFQYAFRRLKCSLGVERYRVLLYLPQQTVPDPGFYHPSMDNYAKVLSDCWMQSIGQEDRALVVQPEIAVELRNTTPRLVLEYQQARRLLYPLAEQLPNYMGQGNEGFGLSRII